MKLIKVIDRVGWTLGKYRKVVYPLIVLITLLALAIPTATPVTADSAGPVASFKFNNIANQTAGAIFSITITALDSAGNIATAYVGTAILSDSGGSIRTTNTAFSDMTDSFSHGTWTGNVTISKTYTDDVITATNSADSSIKGTSNKFNISVGTAASFQFDTIANQTAGSAFSITITALDRAGNTATTYSGSVTLSDKSGSINPTTISFSNGTWTGNVTITKTYSKDTITATDSADNSVTGTSNPGGFNIDPGPAAGFQFDTIANQTAGAAFSITITALDSCGNIATEYVGTAILSDSSGSIRTTNTAFSDMTDSFSNGTWTGNVTISKTYTDGTITATNSADSSVKGTSNKFNIGTGSATVTNPTTGSATTMTPTTTPTITSTTTSTPAPATVANPGLIIGVIVAVIVVITVVVLVLRRRNRAKPKP